MNCRSNAEKKQPAQAGRRTWPRNHLAALLSLAVVTAASCMMPAEARAAIQVQSATWGQNATPVWWPNGCTSGEVVPDGNVTQFAASACDGQLTCTFNVQTQIDLDGDGTYGEFPEDDPAYGCAKTFVLDYTCPPDGTVKNITTTGLTVTLECPASESGIVIDDFDSGSVALEACGNDVYNVHADAGIIGGKREIQLRDGHSCVLGGRSRVRIDATAGVAEWYGRTACEQSFSYGTAIGTIGHSWSPNPNGGQGVPLDLSLTPDSEILVDMVQVQNGFLGIRLFTGAGVFVQTFTKTAGLNSIPLSSFPGMTPAAAAAVDGISFLGGTCPSNTPGTGDIFALLAVAGGGSSDGDGDGIADEDDNCPDEANPDQTDADGDGLGDACDPCTATAPDDMSCDGVDDDCDGSVDEDYYSIGTSCGVGECAAAGQLVCQEGSETDTCQPGAPEPEVCDGLDNDCNGVSDDLDADGDGVNDCADDGCLGTSAGAVVDTTGCSIAQLCPCDNGWRNHGGYVSCTSHAAEEFLEAGLLTEEEKDATVSAAAKSSCGKKKGKK
ncbi:MAG: hypothetical protein ABII00_10155 [Elusimicrobiota bacterium]